MAAVWTSITADWLTFIMRQWSLHATQGTQRVPALTRHSTGGKAGPSAGDSTETQSYGWEAELWACRCYSFYCIVQPGNKGSMVGSSPPELHCSLSHSL